MRINIRAFGPLKHYLGEDRQQVELPEGATLQDLMHVVDTNWGEVLPPQLWDAEKKQFHGVIILADSTQMQELDTPLKENQEVYLVKVMVGG